MPVGLIMILHMQQCNELGLVGLFPGTDKSEMTGESLRPRRE